MNDYTPIHEYMILKMMMNCSSIHQCKIKGTKKLKTTG